MNEWTDKLIKGYCQGYTPYSSLKDLKLVPLLAPLSLPSALNNSIFSPFHEAEEGRPQQGEDGAMRGWGRCMSCSMWSPSGLRRVSLQKGSLGWTSTLKAGEEFIHTGE